MTLPGTRLRIEGWLGDGATSIVYRGSHVDLGRPIAIKVLRGSVNDVMRSRFLEEAQTTTKIDSPYVVDVLDFGELPDGRLYYGMELLAGHSLADELDNGAVSLTRCITLLRMACKGLAAAHRLGVVHRDIKPENMLVVKRWGRQQLILLDFGLATVPNDSSEVCGTPAYMAPEQIRGDALDQRADVYALGCCAHELLTGRQLAPGQSVDELLQAHLGGVHPEFTEHDPVPPALAAVIRKCVALEADDRYASMEELEAALCEAQIEGGFRGLYDDLDPPDVEERRRQRIAKAVSRVGGLRKRRLRRIAVAAAALLAVVTGGWGLIEQRQAEAAQAEQYIHDHVFAAEEAARATRFVYAPAESGDESTALHHVVALEAYDGAGRDDAIAAARRLRDEFGSTLSALGDRYWELDTTRPYARDYYAQALLFDPANERARMRAGMTPGEIADFRARAQARDFRASELLATLPLVLLASAPDHPAKATTPKHRNKPEPRSATEIAKATADPTAALLVAAQTAAPEPDPKARRAQERRAARAKAAAARKARAQASRITRVGRSAFATGDLDDAKAKFEEALRHSPGHAEALAGLSDIYFEQGRHQKAMHFAQLALRGKPSSARNHIRLADAYYRVARYDDAKKHYQRAAELGSKLARRRLELIEET